MYDRFNQIGLASDFRRSARSTDTVTYAFLIIADDLSGAADCAAGFVAAGFDSAVLLGDGDVGAPTPSAAVVTVDTDSRRDVATVAADKARATLARHGAGRRVVKKIDSTLRGGWAAEVAALQPALGLALVAPAFPDLGRTVRGGLVHVDGTPLAETATWRLEHADREARPAHLLEAAGLRTGLVPVVLLEGPPDALRRHITQAREAGRQALVFDTGHAAHLRALAAATLDLPDVFWVASAGLARELARRVPPLPTPASRSAPVDDAWEPGLARCGLLTVVGSLSPVAERQIGCLRARPGSSAHAIGADLLRTPPVAGATPAPWAEAVRADLARGLEPVVWIGADAVLDPAEGPRLARHLALHLAPAMRESGGLVLTGGETARIMLGRLGIARLQVLGESEPGVVLLRELGPHRRFVATKAGAFGDDASLERARQALRAHLARAGSASS